MLPEYLLQSDRLTSNMSGPPAPDSLSHVIEDLLMSIDGQHILDTWMREREDLLSKISNNAKIKRLLATRLAGYKIRTENTKQRAVAEEHALLQFRSSMNHLFLAYDSDSSTVSRRSVKNELNKLLAEQHTGRLGSDYPHVYAERIARNAAEMERDEKLDIPEVIAARERSCSIPGWHEASPSDQAEWDVILHDGLDQHRETWNEYLEGLNAQGDLRVLCTKEIMKEMLQSWAIERFDTEKKSFMQEYRNWLLKIASTLSSS